MKTSKLVLGILSIIISVFVFLQSMAAGLLNAMTENGEVSGSGGLLVSMLMLAGGIVMIATRKAEKKGGSIAGLVLYLLAALLGFSTAGSYKDLNIWAGVCLLLAGLNLIALIQIGKKQKNEIKAREAFDKGENL